ncbi:hypothetical protein TNCV_244921 [Trichonephila clavipes]|uniref:Uncharacterized protein n=1 Tax=Trichonephila clavipes TaxID=2585209 RepID=A0A8X6RUG6_TRICX|nr:hypothetical protein TNCV_244921 [Trichonephila clavipes]
MMDKCADVQTNVSGRVVQEGPASAIVRSRRELRERSGKKKHGSLHLLAGSGWGERVESSGGSCDAENQSRANTLQRNSTRRLHYG